MTKYIKQIFLLSLVLLLQLQVTKIATAQNSQVEKVAEELLVLIKKDLNSRNLDSVYYNAVELIEFSRNNSLSIYEGKGNLLIGGYFFLTNNNDSAIYYYKKAEQIFNKNNNEIFQGHALVRTAIAFRVLGNMDSAVSYYNNALELLTINSDTKWYAFIKNHLGLIYMELGDYYNALESMQDAVIAFQQIGNKAGMGSEYNNMGIVYSDLEDNEKAEEAYLNAINILSEIDITDGLGMAYNNLSSIFIEKGELELALETMEKGKLIFEQTGYLVGLSGYYSVLSSYYNNKKPTDYDKVIESSNRGLFIAKKYNDYRQYAHATNVLGTAYLKTNQIDKAETVLKSGLIVSEKRQYNSISAIITKLLSEVYEKKKQPSLALYYLQKYVVYNDSLINEDKIKNFTSLDLKFKFKQQQISDSIEQTHMADQINFIHANEIYKQKQINLILVFISLIGFIIAGFILFNFFKSKKQASILSVKNNQIEQSLLEKEVLIKEVHHRVKNNFQTVSSLLELQSEDIQDKKALKRINEGQNRIKAMALIHQKLYQNDNITKVNFKEYIEQLVKQIASLHTTKTTINVIDIQLDIDTAISLGLIINELITNAFKYAFSESRKNILTITLEKNYTTNYLLKVADNGQGLPDGIDISKTKSLGLRLIKLLSKQLQGSFNYSYDGGSIFEITFKDENQRREIE